MTAELVALFISAFGGGLVVGLGWSMIERAIREI